jgi:hypothetical protein
MHDITYFMCRQSLILKIPSREKWMELAKSKLYLSCTYSIFCERKLHLLYKYIMWPDIRHYKANRKYYSSAVPFIFIALYYVCFVVSTYVKLTKLIYQNGTVLKKHTDAHLIMECRLLKKRKHSLIFTIVRHCYLQWETSPSKFAL